MGHEHFREDPSPPPSTGQDVLSGVGNLNVIFEWNYKKPTNAQWRKRSNFFELSYWKDNLISHNLDLKHIEKNIGEVLLKWLDALKQKGYDTAKEGIKKIKCPPKVPSASTFKGVRLPLCVPKLHKYHQKSSI